MCGEWDDARADFRRALQLNPSMKWIKELIEMDEPPKIFPDTRRHRLPAVLES
jgi:Tetratricopeptide repeat.